MIEAVIDVPYWVREGANEIKLSPSFSLRVCNQVDGGSAPAFQIMDWYSRFPHRKHPGGDRVVGPILRKLWDIYSTGRGHPTDVYQWGDTVVHKLVGVVTEVSEQYLNARLWKNEMTN